MYRDFKTVVLKYVKLNVDRNLHFLLCLTGITQLQMGWVVSVSTLVSASKESDGQMKFVFPLNFYAHNSKLNGT